MIRLEFVTEDADILLPRTKLLVMQEQDKTKEMNQCMLGGTKNQNLMLEGSSKLEILFRNFRSEAEKII